MSSKRVKKQSQKQTKNNPWEFMATTQEELLDTGGILQDSLPTTKPPTPRKKYAKPSPPCKWIKTNEKDTIRMLFNKYISRQEFKKKFGAQQRIDIAAAAILDHLPRASRSCSYIEQYDMEGNVTSRYKSFVRFVSKLFDEDPTLSESSSPIHSSIEKIEPATTENFPNERESMNSHEEELGPNPLPELSYGSSNDASKLLNTWKNQENIQELNLGMQQKPKKSNNVRAYDLRKPKKFRSA